MFLAKYSLLRKKSYKKKVYFRVAEKLLKERFYNHAKSFTYADYANDAELSKEIKMSNFIELT